MDYSSTMGIRELIVAIAVGTLLLTTPSGICASLGFEVLENPEGKVIEIKSQEDLASLANMINWGNNTTVYILVPASSLQDGCCSKSDRLDEL
jgi:hypothetical protein